MVQYKIVDGERIEMTQEEIDELESSVPSNSTPKIVDAEPQRIACALRIVVQGEEVVAVGGSYRIVGMVFIGAGTFLSVFSENLGSEPPFVIPNNGVSISVSEWGEDYAMIEVRDHAGGSLITPESFGFSLYHF